MGQEINRTTYVMAFGWRELYKPVPQLPHVNPFLGYYDIPFLKQIIPNAI